MGVVSETADRVLVMYAGRAVEQGPREAVFRRPNHPYTWGLLGSVPRVNAPRVRRLPTIPGSPISVQAVPHGCPFQPRCRYRHDKCVERPPLDGPFDHVDACWLPQDQRQELRFRADTAAIAEGDPGDTTEAPAATGVAAEVPTGALQEGR
jgi:peptide/nickel transport system ATP-binding protein